MARVRRIEVVGFDEVLRVECGETVAFVVLHAVLRGRAFGGTRILAYAREEDALLDALALARAMTRKVVLAGLEAGGGKAVLVAPRDEARRAAAVRALGVVVESLRGRFHTGPDMGYGPADDVALRSVTRHLAHGDFAGATARGVRLAMRAACEPRRVAVQGLGAVGERLVELLRSDGVEVVASEVRPVAADVPLVPAQRIHAEPCDVFAPCARGGVLGPRQVEELRASVVCGAANNPLASDSDAERLAARGVVYVPDFVANAGAVIEGASRVLGEGDLVEERMAAIGTRVERIVARAREEGRSTLRVAEELAAERVAALRA